MPTYTDSVDKIVTYFEMITKKPFTYKGKEYFPKLLRVSPDIARGLVCPEGCGGCCSRFSLDFLLSEERPPGCKVREVTVNGVERPVMSMLQKEGGHHCRFLNLDSGRCGVHGRHPFTCDFELIRFAKFADPASTNKVTSRLYGRGWQLLRVDGERGAMCEMVPPTKESRKDAIRKLKRLQRWAFEFGIDSKVPEIIKWLKTDPKEAIIL